MTSWEPPENTSKNWIRCRNFWRIKFVRGVGDEVIQANEESDIKTSFDHDSVRNIPAEGDDGMGPTKKCISP